MNIKEKSFVNKICAMLVIIALTLSDFLFVGKSFISYAIETAQTNSSNVEFVAYFKNGEEGVSKIEKRIDEGETKLYVDITVKNEGYFEGKIALNNNNFNIKGASGEYIKEVSGNEVYLNQINAGSTVTLELEVEPVSDNVISKETLSRETEIILEGNYVNSKNVEKEKYVEIKGTSKVEIDWLSSDSTQMEIDAEVLTNGEYKVEEDTKNVLQLLVSSKITNNNYPVKSTEIEIDVPEEVEKVNVYARSVGATNSQVAFNEENYKYDEENHKLTILVENADESSISWNRSAKDEFVVTYELSEGTEIVNKDIKVVGNIVTYDSKELNNEKIVNINEKIDGIVTYSISNEEESIYKGKIYTGEEREYKTNTKLFVNYLNVANTIEIQENESIFKTEENTISANIVYKSTTINKEEFLKIFGADGYITIKDEQNITIANIDNNTEPNENGDIVINYASNPKSITIVTSSPVELGVLNIKNTKAIENSELSRESVNSLTGIEETINGKYDEALNKTKTSTMTLKNTETNATFNVSTDTLSSIEKNENVKMTVVLENNDESKDLYQNPSIKITLPEQVTKISAKCKVLYGNGLEVSTAKVVTENGRRVIQIDLAGSQSTYNTETLEGTTIIIYANIEIDKLATNSDEEITLNYSNEIATSFKDNGEEKSSVKIVANTGVITTNNIEEYGIETIGDQGTEIVNLDVSTEAKNASVNIKAINNEGASISNVAILGKFPTSEVSNLGVALTSGINLLSNTENVNVYYSDKEEVNADINDSTNGWSQQESTETAKSYLITVDGMQAGEQLEANYSINIPANLSYNLEAEESYKVTYTNNLTETKKEANATVLALTTGTGAEVNASLKASVGGTELSDGDTVYNGEIIKYELTLKNSGNEVAKNINLEAIIPENTTAVQYVKAAETNTETDIETDDEAEPEEGDVLYGPEDYYNTIEVSDNKVSKTIESLEINEEKTITYEVKVNSEAVNNTVASKVTINYKGTVDTETITTTETNTITNPVASSDVSMTMVMTARGSAILPTSIEYSYKLTVANTSGKKLSNVKVEVKTNSEFTLKGVFGESVVGEDEKVYDLDNNTFTIKSLDVDEKISLEIDVLAADCDGTAKISVIANDLYRSNEITETIKAESAVISMTSSNEGEKVKNGDTVIYDVTITNDGTQEIGYLEVGQQISTYLDVTKVTINGEETEFEKEYSQSEDTTEEVVSDDEENAIEESEEYTIGFNYENNLEPGESLNIVVETVSDSSYVHSNNVHLKSVAELNIKELSIKSEEINHILEANVNEGLPEGTEGDKDGSGDNAEEGGSGTDEKENGDGSESGSNSENPENNSGSTSKASTYVISGTAWLDKNGDGQRSSDEENLSGIKVTLLNLENNKTSTSTTSSNGFYSITNVQNGQYVAIFEYDTEKYVLTTYQAEGISDSRNSDVENVTMNIDGTSKKVASTDTLVINGSSATNIDIGLMEAKTFDLELSKTVSKVTVTNTAGTKTIEYNDESLAKVEVKAKYLSGTTVVIEYKIKVTNNGEVAGYVKNVVDYKPSDLTFNSSLNPDWYQSGDYVYSNSLASTKLEAGETKELKLVLTKTMTTSNTGLVNNTAEISDAYNSLGVSDVDSTPGNKASKEDDMGSANVIISVNTGAAVSYIALTLSIIIIIGAGAYIISKKVLKENIKF